MPCNKIDKQIFGKRHDVHINVAYIMTTFYYIQSNEIQKNID